MQIVLASQSPYRKAQLENFGLAFTAVKPEVDEDALKKQGPSDLTALTRFLSLRKAESVRARFPQALILGSDQIAELGETRLDKPGTRTQAVHQLTVMQGRAHRLLTSLTILAPGKPAWTGTETTRLEMRPLTGSEIEAYLDLDQPFDCAGSYKIERAGLGLIERIEGRDPSAIQGLPLIVFCEGLRELDIELTHLWRSP